LFSASHKNSINMKKIFTLLLGLSLSAAVFAADHRPTVTVNSARNYEVVIDGRNFSGNNRGMNAESLRNGRHTIQVYDLSRGLFKSRRLISTQSFQLRNNDVVISIDRFGSINIMENRYGNNGRDWNGRDNSYNNDRRDTRDNGYSNGRRF
jgi:hypothetical protein